MIDPIQSDTVSIDPGERGQIRIFALSMPRNVARGFETGPTSPSSNPEAIAGLMGLETVDLGYVELFPISNLGEMPLSEYLTIGLGADPAPVRADRARLDALDGHVMAVLSRAVAPTGAELSLDPRLTLIGQYAEEGLNRPDIQFGALPAESAKGQLDGAAGGTTAPRRARPLLFGLVLLVLALLGIVMARAAP